MSPTQDQTALRGNHPIATGNVSVTVSRHGPAWSIKVGVFGEPDALGHRVGLSTTLNPGKFANAKELTDAVGRTAALEAKLLARAEMTQRKRAGKRARPCIDETDAYKGAVRMFEEVMLELRARGKA
jgi:hypothetical protein